MEIIFDNVKQPGIGKRLKGRLHLKGGLKPNVIRVVFIDLPVTFSLADEVASPNLTVNSPESSTIERGRVKVWVQSSEVRTTLSLGVISLPSFNHTGFWLGLLILQVRVTESSSVTSVSLRGRSKVTGDSGNRSKVRGNTFGLIKVIDLII